MNKNWFVYSCIILTIIFSAVIYISYQTLMQPTPKKITIAVSKTPLSAPFYIAQKLNYFDANCITVNFSDVFGGTKAFEEVIQGRADFATSSDSVIAFQTLNDQKFVTLATFVQSDNDVKLITRDDDNIASGIDLKSKRIGVIQGSASEYYLSIYLALAGLSFNDVQIKYYPPNKLITAFEKNEVDAIVPWEPFAFQSMQHFGSTAKIHHTKNLYTLTFNVLSKELENKDQLESAKCLLDGLNSAINFIASNPEPAKKIIMNKLNLSNEFINWIWPDYIFKLSLNRSLLLSIDSQANWAVQSNMSKTSQLSDASRFIDTRALLHINPMAVNIKP